MIRLTAPASEIARTSVAGKIEFLSTCLTTGLQKLHIRIADDKASETGVRVLCQRRSEHTSDNVTMFYILHTAARISIYAWGMKSHGGVSVFVLSHG